MRNTLISWKKELKTIFRDKKFVSIIFFMPLIIPAFILGYGALYESMASTDGFKVGINYQMSEDESTLMKSIDEDLEIVSKSNDELKQAYDNKEIDAYVIKEDKKYTLYIDTSTTTGMSIQEVLKLYFEKYNMLLGNNYLLEHNINPNEVFNNFEVEYTELSKDGNDYFSNFMVTFALIYLVMIITITAMNTSTDIIAGEKERGTFETLLTFPLKSNEIIGGKLLAIVSSCIVSSTIGIATAIPALFYIKNHGEMFSKLNINISVNSVLLALLSVVLTSAMVGVISIFLCGKAKTFKEAQSKVSFLSMISLIPMFTDMMNVNSNVLYMIPIASGGTILNDIFLKGVTLEHMLIFIATSIVVTVVAVFVVSKQYKDEKALF